MAHVIATITVLTVILMITCPTIAVGIVGLGG